MKVVIVGGVAGGASAAARLRRLDEQAQIVIFERTGFVSYANCGLPYYIGGVIEEESALTLQSPKGFWDRFRIAVKTSHEVFAIHPDSHTVEVRNMLTARNLSRRMTSSSCRRVQSRFALRCRASTRIKSLAYAPLRTRCVFTAMFESGDRAVPS